jgi:membrane protease YdiL (CAAX protease family)
MLALIANPGEISIRLAVPVNNNSKSRVWRKIGCFYVLTLIFSWAFGGFILRSGRIEAGNLLFVTGAMWSPAMAAFATKKIFREQIGELPWQWARTRYIALAYFLPFAYSLPIYLFVWLTGFGAFNKSSLAKVLADFGWQNLPTGVGVSLFVLFTATLGMVAKLSRALGEEIGWRGFLVPELAKVTGFFGVGTISGLMWAAFHYPVLLFADYNAGAPAWYSLVCFTLSAVAGSFIMAWLTLRTQSLWPAAILHASHNLFIQSILTPLTMKNGLSKYMTDEFGLGLVVTVSLAALLIVKVFGRSTELTVRSSALKITAEGAT